VGLGLWTRDSIAREPHPKIQLWDLDRGMTHQSL
jgi:hypothetical protein